MGDLRWKMIEPQRREVRKGKRQGPISVAKNQTHLRPSAFISVKTPLSFATFAPSR